MALPFPLPEFENILKAEDTVMAYIIGSVVVVNNKTEPSADQQTHLTLLEPVYQLSQFHVTLDQILIRMNGVSKD